MDENSKEMETGYSEENDDYDRLPAAIKAMHPRKGWLWLSDKEKALLERTECEPESYDD